MVGREPMDDAIQDTAGLPDRGHFATSNARSAEPLGRSAAAWLDAWWRFRIATQRQSTVGIACAEKHTYQRCRTVGSEQK